MAFIFNLSRPTASPTRITPTCKRRNNRRPSRRIRRPHHKPATKTNSGVMENVDIDTTDITTYISCPVCFNSIMLRPQQLADAPLRVVCNCCEQKTDATLERLENMDGTSFNAMAWRKGMMVAAGQPAPYTEQDVASFFEENSLFNSN
eukprot:gb/GEZJ01005520.1/.p1 GENE.gb/GEZJ01005520.1/~~gb/GEZJ01005520.1/.p1  ORF type:complete len:148 (-),score=14.34 gb/GEZJ01005520.1/:775-1218(-)